MNWLKRFLKRTHRHKWRGTMFNRYEVAMEERCEGCGKYRHLLNFRDSCNDNYHEGPHPIAVDMRAIGITCNY